MTTKALVLSGGGGRGAYHVGVIEALVEQGWIEDGKGPDIIAGTSIGAINAAALAAGLTVAQLKRLWLKMHTEDVHCLSPDLPPVVRPVLNFLLGTVLTSQAHHGTSTIELSPEERTMSTGSFLARMGSLFRGREFRSLLDTTPWRHTLSKAINFDQINRPAAPALLLTATEVRSGALRIFCNQPLHDQPADTITIDHLMASSSIPAVYPWTQIDADIFWDGALLANTPLGPVIDLAGDDDVDIKVVIMTPWRTTHDLRTLDHWTPHNLVESLSMTLDWTLLGSYRRDMKLLQAYNELLEAAERLDRAAATTGDESLRLPRRAQRPVRLPTIIAPEAPMPITWIIDYEEENHRTLFEWGRRDALRALREENRASR
ncbi:MAG: patatin-like phospholipase family protein [Chloroflexaceae bacterium]|nr:patatin-like phospholipase family protein [Chloroflexaceae bacterium]